MAGSHIQTVQVVYYYYYRLDLRPRADPGILERGAYAPCKKTEKVSLRRRCAKNENQSAK